MNLTCEQFYLSHDHQLVSVMCPEKVLTADCTSGMLVFRDSAYGETAGHHQWNVNSDDGSITYAECPDLQLSSAEDSLGTLESFYFSLMNPTTGMVMGVDGEDCITDGTNITIQNAVICSFNQKLYMDADFGRGNLTCTGESRGNTDTCCTTENKCKIGEGNLFYSNLTIFLLVYFYF